MLAAVFLGAMLRNLAVRAAGMGMVRMPNISTGENAMPRDGQTATSARMPDATACALCGCPIPPRRRRGSPRRYCSAEHRREFWSAAHAWVRRAFDEGLISAADLLRVQVSARASGKAFHEATAPAVPGATVLVALDN